MLYLKLFEDFETDEAETVDFQLEFIPQWKFDTSYSNTQRIGFNNKIYQALSLHANRNGMRTNQIGGEHPVQIILKWNRKTNVGTIIFNATFLVRKYEEDTPYVLCLLDYKIIGEEDLKSLYIRMELQDMMGVIKNLEKFSQKIISKVLSLS